MKRKRYTPPENEWYREDDLLVYRNGPRVATLREGANGWILTLHMSGYGVFRQKEPIVGTKASAMDQAAWLTSGRVTLIPEMWREL